MQMVSTMINQIISSIVILLSGIVIGVGGTMYVISYTQPIPNHKTVQVDNISGGLLAITNVLRTKTSTTIDTKYDGAGESRITVPTAYYKYSVCSFISTDRSIYVGGGYSWGRVQALCGVWFRNNNCYTGGLWLGCIYQF